MTVTATTELVIEHCCSCGIPFAMPKDLYLRRRRDHRDFWCPHGHSQRYIVESEAEKLRGELEAVRDQRDTARKNARHFERSAIATRGHLTRLKRRIAHGTCPCCRRTFKQLSQHMERQHPEYVAEHGVHDHGERAR